MISENKILDINDLSIIENIINSDEIILLKFDNLDSNYNSYIYNIGLKIINITDKEIIDFYEIDILPTILVFKNKNLIDSIKGFHTKTSFIGKIIKIIE